MAPRTRPLDAARLDIMPAGLWGRAEGVRTLLRQSAQAAAPLVFGLIADALSGSGASQSQQHVSPASARALQETFLILLVPLALSGLMLLLGARCCYPADVATAIASERAPSGEARDSPSRRRSYPRRRSESGSSTSPARTTG